MRAVKLEKEIDDQIKSDQGARYRGFLKDLLPRMDDAYRGEEDPFRPHLGASIIGRECDRQLWLNFRWAKKPRFDGRTLRLFNRGHLEEAHFIAMLKCIGVQVWFETEEGGQFKIARHSGHYGSAVDCFASGIPDMPDIPMVGEFKTHSAKSFAKLEKEGVQKSKPEHYAQMNQYMGAYGVSHAIYMAVNKDNDSLYCEIVTYDEHNFWHHYNRALDIISAQVPPPRISTSPAWYTCKWCDYHPICHSNQTAEKTCRSCGAAKALLDGKTEGNWYCHHHEQRIDKDRQLKGCSNYHMLPEIIAKV